MKCRNITKSLLSAGVTIALAASMIGGATYALFTDKDEVNVAITSGKVDVTAVAKNLKVYSPTAINLDGTVADANNAVDENGNKFYGGGTATLEGGTLTLDKIASGDRVNFDIDFSNQSNIAAKYRVTMDSSSDLVLMSGLEISITRNLETEVHSFTRIARYISEWRDLPADQDAIETLHIQVGLPADRGNEYQGLKCNLRFAIEAVQSNTNVKDESVLHGGEEHEPYVERLELVYAAQELREKVAATGAGEKVTLALGKNLETPSLSQKLNAEGKLVASAVLANKDITIDLNEKTLTMTNASGICATIKENASLTMRNGTLVTKRTDKREAVTQVFFVGGSTAEDSNNNYTDSLTLEDVEVNYTTDTTVTHSWTYLITSNANNAYAKSNVTVKDTTFNVTGLMMTAFYLPNDGTRSFINSHVKGAHVSTSFFIVGGSWNIEGGSYVGNKYELGTDGKTIQDKILLDTDPIWQSTVPGLTNEYGIVGAQGFATGDAICILTRYNKGRGDKPQPYVLGDIRINNVSFTIGTAELSEADKASAAKDAILSGPSGYAVRVYDVIPEAERGNISITNLKVTAPKQVIKGETGNTERILKAIDVCKGDYFNGKTVTSSVEMDSFQEAGREETKATA